MSLQGTIETFAIADVLRLLAATSKSGRLQVQGPSRSGTVWVDDARVLSAESPSVPNASQPADVLFQLLRFERGSFRFDLDRYPPSPGEPVDIEQALGDAESMLAEWRELEKSIPSTEAWVSLKRDLKDATVTISADQWKTVGAVGSGRTISSLGDTLSLGELETYRAVDQLLGLGLVDIGTRPLTAPPEAIAPPAPPVLPPVAPGAPVVEPAEDSDARRRLDAAASTSALFTPATNGTTESAPSPVRPVAEAPPAPAEPPAAISFAPPPAAPAPPSEPGLRADAGLTQSWVAPTDPAPAFPPSFDPPSYEPAPFDPPSVDRGDLDHGSTENGSLAGSATTTGATAEASPVEPAPAASTAATAPAATAAPAAADHVPPGYSGLGQSSYGEYPYGASSYGATDERTTFEFTTPFAQPPAPPAGPSPEVEISSGRWIAPPAPPSPEGGSSPAGSPLFEAPAPPPPPAPPVPPAGASVPGSGWSPSAWYDGSAPERIAPPPPPPPPPGGPAWGEPPTARDANGAGDSAVATAANGSADETGSTEDAANIERQLFNLSERAREAVKRSSGLFDGRPRR